MSDAPHFEGAEKDEKWMRLALEEARRAAQEHADVPVGCVIVSPLGQLVARGRNRREIDADPTAHAEIDALRAATRSIGHWRLEGHIAYVTLEPCPMCAGALVNARIGRVVFGAYDAKAGALESLFSIGNDARLNHRFEHTGGVLQHECAAELKKFFQQLRAAGEK